MSFVITFLGEDRRAERCERERDADRARSFLIFAENGTNVTYRMLFAPRIDNTVSGNFTNGIAASFISAPFVPSFRSSLSLGGDFTSGKHRPRRNDWFPAASRAY